MASADASEAPDVPAPRDRDYEWMSREAWWQRHRALLALGPELKLKSEVAFLGDSITEGWDDSVWNEAFGRYTPLRLGIGGDKTQQVLFRIEQGELLGMHPKVLVLLIGTNNFGLGTATPADVATGVQAVVKAVQAKLPDTHVLLLGILPRDQLPGTPARQNLSATNALLAGAKLGDKVHYLDISRHFLDRTGRIPQALMTDFLHPTKAGYRIFAQAISPKLRELVRAAKK